MIDTWILGTFKCAQHVLGYQVFKFFENKVQLAENWDIFR